MQLVLNNCEGEIFTVEVEPTDTFQDLVHRVEKETGFHFDIAQLNIDGNPISPNQNVSELFSVEEISNDDAAESHAEWSLICAVPECTSTANVIFPFPSEVERCHHWAAICRRYDLMEEQPDYVSTHYGICPYHFINDSFEDSSKSILKEDAVPTIFKVYNDDDDTEANNNGQNIKKINNWITDKNSTKNLVLDQKSKGKFINSDTRNGCDDSTDNYSVGKLCRLCAKTSVEFIYIFGNDGEKKKLAEKINSTLPITVNLTDPLPKQLCIDCVQKVNSFHEFAESCLRADKKLNSLSKRKKFLSKKLNGLLALPPAHPSSDVDSDSSNLQLDIIGENNTKSMSSYNCPLCFDGKMLTNGIIKEGKREIHFELLGRIDDISFPEFNHILITPGSTDFRRSWEDAIFSSDLTAEEYDTGDVLIVNAVENDSRSKDTEVISCIICGELFDNLELCLNHSKDHALSDVFPCSRCDLCFSDELSFNNHIKEHRQESSMKLSLQCRTCKKRFNDEIVYSSHPCMLSSSSSARPFKCLECGRFFRTESRLLFHIQCHLDGTSIIGCEHCGKVFSRETNLFEHVRLVHMGEKSYQCHICKKSFQLKTRLITHLRVHAGERPFECSVCNGKFYDSATLKGHLITHLHNKPFKCDKCKKCFSRKSLFKQHVSAHHSEVDSKPPKVYKCKLCGALFPSVSNIIEHKKQIHKVENSIEEEEKSVSKPFICEVCGKSFAFRVTLVAHNRHHTGEFPHQCEICGKMFTQKRSLTLHRRTHTGEKPYHCDTCGRMFSQSAHLYAHQRLHTGEKPYPCKLCGQSFRLKDVRDAHERKHTGERPFKCNVCEKAFRTSHSYYQHMWIHEGKKPYPCRFCGKAFRRSNGLKIHIRIHTGEKPHVCDICNRGFAQKQDMKKHRNLHLSRKLLS